MKKNKLEKIKNKSVFVLGAVLWMSVIFLFSSEPNLRSSFPYNIDLVLRKIAHIVEYAVLTFFIYKAIRPWAKNNLALVVFLLSLSWAVLDECHQMFVAGREGTVRDVLFDLVGILIVIYFIIRKKKNGKRKKRNA